MLLSTGINALEIPCLTLSIKAPGKAIFYKIMNVISLIVKLYSGAIQNTVIHLCVLSNSKRFFLNLEKVKRNGQNELISGVETIIMNY